MMTCDDILKLTSRHCHTAQFWTA